MVHYPDYDLVAIEGEGDVTGVSAFGDQVIKEWRNGFRLASTPYQAVTLTLSTLATSFSLEAVALNRICKLAIFSTVRLSEYHV